jgi:bifunctional DNase/RNase
MSACRNLIPLSLFLVLLGWALPACAERGGDDNGPDGLVEVELSTVGMDARSGTPVALLRDSISGEVVPIFIGLAEAEAILRALHEVSMPRPMTHDLMGEVIGALDARMERVIVHDIINGTYYGRLELRRNADGELLEIDTRPSDGLALALRTGARIAVTRKILQAGLDFDFRSPEGAEDVVQAAGITVVEAPGNLREELGLPGEPPGVLVSRVTGTAPEAGLEPGDLIIEVNGKILSRPLDFLDLLRQTPVGEEAEIVFLRGHDEHRVKVSTDVRASDPAETERL